MDFALIQSLPYLLFIIGTVFGTLDYSGGAVACFGWGFLMVI